MNENENQNEKTERLVLRHRPFVVFIGHVKC